MEENMSKSLKEHRLDDIHDLLVAAGPLKLSQIERAVGVNRLLTLRDLRALVLKDRAEWVSDEKAKDPEIAVKVKATEKKKKDDVQMVEFDPRVDMYTCEADLPEYVPIFPELSGRHEAAAKVLRMLMVRTPKTLAAAGNYSYRDAERLMAEIEERLGHTV